MSERYNAKGIAEGKSIAEKTIAQRGNLTDREVIARLEKGYQTAKQAAETLWGQASWQVAYDKREACKYAVYKARTILKLWEYL